MTREEVKELLVMIRALYPNFNLKPEELTGTINAWHMMLEEYPADAVGAALKIYAKTNNTGFAPSVSQLIGAIYAPRENNELSEGEAWALVKDAIRKGAYDSQEMYDALPETVQRAVGNPAMIHEWAMTDSDTVNTVIMSNFQRSYKAVLARREFNSKISADLSNAITKRDVKEIEG